RPECRPNPGAEVRSRADERDSGGGVRPGGGAALCRAGRATGDPYCHAPAGAGPRHRPCGLHRGGPGAGAAGAEKGGDGMLKDITLGQFFPGDTVAHRLDPRTKILLVVLYIVALFCAKSLLAYGILAAVLAVCVRISRVGIKSLVRGLKPVVFIIVFTGILNLFFTPGEHILAELGFLRISAEGLQNAVFMVLRIMLLIMGTFLMTYTTSPISLTDGLERLLGGLKKIHVPVHELAMIMSIALRFIPTLIEETDKIMSAQKARGADFESGNIIQKAKALIPILVP
ncbi:Glycerophosphodiester phosphodiesterase, partial [Dysosmobacter welbionis]